MSGDKTDHSDHFFKKLRKIARHVEHSVEDLKKLSESEHGTQGHMNVAKKLLDLKKDVKKLKADGNTILENLYRDGNEHSEIINLCNSLINKQRKRLENIEAFYQQYGYVKPEMKSETPIKEKKVSENKEKEEKSEEKVEDKPVETPPKVENAKPKVFRTPKLEDFGLSQFTLDRLARAEKMNEPFSYIQEVTRKPEPKTTDDLPQIFQHNGLFMTPSVLGGKTSLQTPDHNHKHISQFNSPVWTPFDDQSRAKEMAAFNEQVDAKLNLFANYNETESPVPPKPKTTGLYQQNVSSSKSTTCYSSLNCDVKTTSSMFSDTSYKHLSGNTAHSNRSQAPALSAKKQSDFTKSILSKLPKMKINASVLDEDYEPKRPEPTVDLSSITGTYRHPVNIGSTVTEPDKPSTSTLNTGITGTSVYRGGLDKEPEAPELTVNFKDLRTREHFFSPVQKEFKPMTEKYGTSKTENKTPPVPELFSDRLNQKLENGDSNKAREYCGYGGNVTSTPPPPKLMGNYSFLRKSAMQENVPP